MTEFLKSLNWTTEDWALLVSIVALVSTIIFNVFSYYISRRSWKLELQKYKDEQDEKSKRKLEISIHEVKKCEDVPDRPLKWFGVWLVVNNRSGEQVLFKKAYVELKFNKLQSGLNPVERFILNLSPISHQLSFILYSAGIEMENICEVDEGILDNFCLLDWNSKEKVFFNSENIFCLPEQNQKRIWYLFGSIPEKDGMKLMESGYYLRELVLSFVTDTPNITVKKNFFRRQWIRKDDLEEYTRYHFKFERAKRQFILIDPSDK